VGPGAWVLGCFLCYGLGVFNERWWPGERLIPLGVGEAALWGIVIGICAAPWFLSETEDP
jgi:hypothetical protein